MIKNHKFVLILIAGIFLRLLFSYNQYSGDIKNHYVWGNAAIHNSNGLYSTDFEGFNDVNYPPLAIYFFSLSNLLYIAFVKFVNWINGALPLFPSSVVWFVGTENMRYAFLKLPSIIADIFTFSLLYKYLSKDKTKNSLFLSSLFFLNPAVIYITSVWGQIESITIFFLVASLFTAFNKQTHFWSIPLFILGSLVKQTTLWFVIFYLIVWVKKIKPQILIRSTIFSLFAFYLLYLPFGLNPYEATFSYLSTLTGSSTIVSDAAWNLWYFLYPVGTEDSIKLLYLTVRQISVILLISYLFVSTLNLLKNYQDGVLYKYLFYWSIVVFFIQTRVHERHLVFALLFFILAYRKKRTIPIYVIITLFHLANLFYSLKLPYI